MLLAVIAFLFLAAGVGYWLMSRRSPAPARGPQKAKESGKAKEPGKAKESSPFGSVEIRTRAGACDAARELVGQRFLAKEAPTLPLAACKSAQCSCSFVKLSDRRTDGRRLEHEGLGAALFQSTNRRSKRDRRAAKKKRS